MLLTVATACDGAGAKREGRARRGAIPICRASGRSPRSRRSSGRPRSPDKAQLTEQEAAEAEKTFQDDPESGSSRRCRHRCRCRSRLQRFLVGSRNESRLDAPDVARRRSARWASAGVDRRRAGARDRACGARLRLVGRPKPVGALHHARAADDPGSVQQQLSDSPDARLRRDPPRDDSRRAHHSSRRTSARRSEHPPVVRRLARPMGRRHARRRHDQFHRQGELQRIHCRAASHRALHPRRRGHGEIRIHDRRSDDVHEEVDRGDSDGADRRADLRVRVSRGELRDGEPAQRGASAGKGGGQK